MANVSSVVKITNPTTDDLFLCHAFAKAISCDRIQQIIEQQQPVLIESTTNELSASLEDNSQTIVDSPLTPTSIQWKIGDLCWCPYSEDGLLYKATILDIQVSSLTCTVSFDDYGNEEIHPFTDLQIRTEPEQEETSLAVNEHDILPPPPSLPTLNFNDDNDTLSSTLMSWYLAGYHTGFYQGIKNKENFQK